MRIALAQLNPIIGDVAGNTALVLEAIDQAKRDRADVLLTSELVLIGYPPRDLLLREGVVEDCEIAVRTIAKASGDLWVIVGHPRKVSGKSRTFCNSASVCHRGKVVAVADKQLLPGYDVFDEDRYFEPGDRSCVVEIAGTRAAVFICEDLWRAEDVNAQRRYPIEPICDAITQHAEIILTLNASPFVQGKWKRHLEQLGDIARQSKAPVIAVNQVGGNDDLVFDGRSVLVDRDGSIRTALKGFEADVQVMDVPVRAIDAHGLQSVGGDVVASKHVLHWTDPLREVYHALVLGIRDYVRKTGHTSVLLGLSGGIDSALTATLAAAALGAKSVHGVMMPSRYSSAGSIDDSKDLAKRLGLASCIEVPIEQAHQNMQQTLSTALGEHESGVTDENVQARLRGIILMALSNATPGGRSLVLTTGNKSEIATGYCTLYGDMSGGVAPLGDLLKTRLYELSRWINANFVECGFAQPPIPEASLRKVPTAELRPNQTDQDTLPPYPVLDEIIERFIERDQSPETIIAETDLEESLVRRWTRVIDQMQYKRDQAAVIPKLTPRAFGRGRPMPIVMKQSTLSDQPSAKARPRQERPAPVL
jgi:NAD+ synthase (glutamine-hydrolysing)